jgi:hypothetical protein
MGRRSVSIRTTVMRPPAPGESGRPRRRSRPFVALVGHPCRPHTVPGQTAQLNKFTVGIDLTPNLFAMKYHRLKLRSSLAERKSHIWPFANRKRAAY